MLFYTTRFLRNGTNYILRHGNLSLEDSLNTMQVRGYAARKGTRERKKKAKVKAEVEKVGFIPHNQRKKEKLLLNRPSKKFDESWKRDPVDNVFVKTYFKQVVYSFEEAIQCHRETNHPEIYNKPNANVLATIELNMEGEKKTRFVDNFTRIVGISHRFDHGEERSVIAFSKTPEYQKEAIDAGAQLAGGPELIKRIQNGELNLQDFQFIIAHPDILPELVALRGLLKKKFPNPRAGTLDGNLGETVEKFLHGINYTAAKDEHEKDYGSVETVIGTLNMEAKHLEENFSALVKDIFSMKPKRSGPFITRALVWSPPSREKLRVDHDVFLEVAKTKDATEEEVVEERVAL